MNLEKPAAMSHFPITRNSNNRNLPSQFPFKSATSKKLTLPFFKSACTLKRHDRSFRTHRARSQRDPRTAHQPRDAAERTPPSRPYGSRKRACSPSTRSLIHPTSSSQTSAPARHVLRPDHAWPQCALLLWKRPQVQKVLRFENPRSRSHCGVVPKVNWL